MKKYLLGAMFSLALLASPAFTQAAGLTNEQIQAILSLLTSFGAESAVVAKVNAALTGDASVASITSSVSASTSPSVAGGQPDRIVGCAKRGGVITASSPRASRICDLPQKNLSQGMRGDEVRDLQEFLSEEGQLSADSATGYFGPMTAQAVVKWQVSQGVQGVGSVGPMTRERIKILCGKPALVCMSPNTAYSKSSDAAIRSNLDTIRMQAEIYWSNPGNNSYGTAGTSCTTAGSLFVDATIAKAITLVESANGTGTVACNNSLVAHAVSSQLYSNSARFWCVDSTGASSNSTTALGTNTVCPASN